MILLLLFPLARVHAAGARSRDHWSVTLREYGDKAPFFSSGNLAASDDFVALAIQSPVSVPTQMPPKKPILDVVSVRFFDARHGNRVDTCGPWLERRSPAADVWETAQGNFLLLLGPPDSQAKQPSGPRLFLLSASCEKLVEADLPAAEPRGWGWRVRISPSRRFLALQDYGQDVSKVQIREADTLALLDHWTEPRTASHRIIGLNDDAVLGADLGKTGEFKPTRYVRSFHGPWRKLAVQYASAFLSPTHLVTVKMPTTPFWKTGKVRIGVNSFDGTSIFAKEVSGFQYWVGLYEFRGAGDGRHFGGIFEFAGAGWLWGNLDMGPEHQTIYIWSSPDPKPVMKIRVHHKDTADLALPPSGNWVAWLDGSTLRLRSLPAK